MVAIIPMPGNLKTKHWEYLYSHVLPGIQYHSRHSFHWKVLLPSAEHKTHSITAGILNSLLFFYIIRNRQDPGKTNFPAAVTALLISGISSSHLRNLNFHWSMFTVKQIISPDGGGAKYHFFWWPFLPLWDAWDTWKWYCSRAGVKLGICFNEESDPIIYFWRSLPPQAIHLSNTFLHCHPNQWQVIFCCTACPTYCCQKSLNESNPAMHP